MYYGIIFNLDNIGVNPYINMVILGLIEFPAYGLSIWLLDILGRKKLLIGSLLFAGTFCTICGFVPKGEIILNELYARAKMHSRF